MDALHVGEEFGVVGFLLVPMYNTIPETGFGGICKKIVDPLGSLHVAGYK